MAKHCYCKHVGCGTFGNGIDMKNEIIIVLATLLNIFSPKAKSQEPIPIDRSSRPPVLNENIRGEELLQSNDNRLPEYIFSEITPQQKEMINSLTVERDKRLKQINRELFDKWTQLRTLELAEKPEIKSIHKTINGIGTLIIKQMKVEAECKQKIRRILTEKQRIEFDLRNL